MYVSGRCRLFNTISTQRISSRLAFAKAYSTVNVAYTSEKYPNIKRRSDLKKVAFQVYFDANKLIYSPLGFR
jgi:hypothetical protein